MVNLYIVYELNLWSHDLGTNPTLVSSLIEAFTLAKNADIDECGYSGYGIRFDVSSVFPLSNGNGFGKKIVIFGVDCKLLVHVDYKKKELINSWTRPNRWIR